MTTRLFFSFDHLNNNDEAYNWLDNTFDNISEHLDRKVENAKLYVKALSILSAHPQYIPDFVDDILNVGVYLIINGFANAVCVGNLSRYSAKIKFLDLIRETHQEKNLRDVSQKLESITDEELGIWKPLFQYHRAHVAHLLGNYKDALATYEELSRFQGDSKDVVANDVRGLANKQVADVKMLFGRFNEAMASAEMIEKLTRVNNHLKNEARRIIGHIYRFNMLYHLAEMEYSKVLQDALRTNNESMVAKALTNLAETWCWTAPVNALKYCQLAIEKNNKIGEFVEVGKAMTAMSIAQSLIGEKERAIRTAQMAARLQEENGYRTGVLFALQALGLAQTGDERKATLSKMWKLVDEIDGAYQFLPLLVETLVTGNVDESKLNKIDWINPDPIAELKRLASMFK